MNIPKYIETKLYKIIMLISVFIVISTVITGTPSIFGLRPMFVVSESMEPTIKKYQFILAKVMDAEDIKKGDIVVYVIKDKHRIFKKYIAHRVIKINADGTYCLKGDNNDMSLEIERNIDSKQIKYKVIRYW